MNQFIIIFLVIFFVLLAFLICSYIFFRTKLRNFKKSLFFFTKFILIIDVKRKTINLRIFGKKEEMLWTKDIKIEKFLKNFQYESKNSKNFFLLLKKISELTFSNNWYKDFLKDWKFYHKNFFFYSIHNTFLGRNIFSNLKVDLYIEEEDLIYAHGNYINFKKLNIERIFTEKNLEIVNQEKFVERAIKDIGRKGLKRYFLINIFDNNIQKSAGELESYRYFIIYIFAIWLKKEKYNDIYITSDYNIYLLTNKHLYKSVYLNNRYWYEKIRIIYQDFLDDLGINGDYNNLKVITSYEFNETIESLNKTIINFNILQDFIKTKRHIDYSYVYNFVEKIYNYEMNFNKKAASDLVYQKEFKSTEKNIESYVLFSLNINLNENVNLDYFLNPKKIYQEFFKQIKKICSQNKNKFYRVIIPIRMFNELDFSEFNDLINIKIYIEAFTSESNYLAYRNYISKVDLNNKRFGLYIDDVKYAWEIIKISRPRNLWISNSIYKNQRFNLDIEYFFEKVKNYSIGEKVSFDK